MYLSFVSIISIIMLLIILLISIFVYYYLFIIFVYVCLLVILGSGTQVEPIVESRDVSHLIPAFALKNMCHFLSNTPL